MRAVFVALCGLVVAGCSLFADPDIVRLDGQSVSAVEVEGARASCSNDRSDVCLAALGYASVNKERTAQAQANLQRIAEDNRQERERLALAAEMERQKKIKMAAAAKKKKRQAAPAAPALTTGAGINRRLQ